jgi:hypothetical protein
MSQKREIFFPPPTSTTSPESPYMLFFFFDILSRSFFAPDTQMLKENHTRVEKKKKSFSKAASRTQISENFSMPKALRFDVILLRKEARNDKTCSTFSPFLKK